LKLKDYFNLRKRIERVNLFIVIELIIFVSVILFLNYIIEGKIITESGYVYYVVSIIISLYYGLMSGIISVSLIFAIVYFFTHKFNTELFLDTLLIALVAGEFNFYFKLNLLRMKEQVKYLTEKLRKISRSAFFTKLSHDNLEKNYLIKPYSIRKLIIDIATNKNKNDFVEFLANQFNIISFSLVDIDKKEYKYNLENVNKNDELIEEMLGKKEITYLTDKQVEYLAAIPIFNAKDKLVAYIVIKDISFIKFNMENLIAIQFISNYFYLKLEEEEMTEQYKNSKYCKYLLCNKVVEMDRIVKLNKFADVESSFLTFDIEKVNSEKFENFLSRGLRVLDFFTKIELKDKNLFIIVLPFTSKEGGYFFAQRLLNIFDFLDMNDIDNIYVLDSLDKIEKIIEQKNEL
jgi:uncharacterized membrane protein YhaH (DUF805 family)